MDLSVESRRRLMTPSGRLERHWAGWGEPRPTGPRQELVPVGRGGVGPQRGRAGTDPSLESLPIAMLKLDSPLVQPSGTPAIAWQHLLINFWRLAQPTGVSPGTVNGVTVNAHGQVISTQASGATIDSPALTGTPTAPTPAANDNSSAIATTQWVQEQGYLTTAGDVMQTITITGDATGSGQEDGSIPVAVIRIQGRPVSNAGPSPGQALVWNGSAWVPGGIGDAPSDGNIYGRQNGAWVVVTVAPPEGLTEGPG